jgi:glycosyltransferase involved in cell wall biosynthesis
MRSNRILIVTPNSGYFGGTERVLEVLLAGPCQNFELVVAFLEQGPLVDLARQKGIANVCITRGRFRNPISTFKTVRQLRGFIKEIRPDIIFSWTDLAHVYSVFASWRLVPCCWWQRSNVERDLLSFLCRNLPSLGAVPNSLFVRRQLTEHKIRVTEAILYPPYDENRFFQRGDLDSELAKKNLRARLNLPVDRLIVGSVGRLQSWKGFETIVYSISKLLNERSDLHCLLIGAKHELEPAYEDRLRAIIISLGIHDRVTMIGAQRDVTSWMLAMDIFVHAAEREPFGIVVPEAMALGLPVIASIPGGPEEVITHGVDGFLVTSNSVEELAQAIKGLCESRTLRHNLGLRAISRAKVFASNDFGERLLRLLETLVS